jgi:hypothetical protein
VSLPVLGIRGWWWHSYAVADGIPDVPGVPAAAVVLAAAGVSAAAVVLAAAGISAAAVVLAAAGVPAASVVLAATGVLAAAVVLAFAGFFAFASILAVVSVQPRRTSLNLLKYFTSCCWRGCCCSFRATADVLKFQ